MHNQYKKIQESNPMFDSSKIDDERIDEVDQETSITVSATTALEIEPNLDASEKSRINNDNIDITLKNCTQSSEKTKSTFPCIREIEKEDEGSPLLKTNCCQREMTTEEACLSQLNIDHNNYLQNIKSAPSQDSSAVIDQSSLIV